MTCRTTRRNQPRQTEVVHRNVRPHNMHTDTQRLHKSLAMSVLLVLGACASSHPALLSSEAVASQRLAQYAELLRRQDSSAIAAMFEPAGSMAHQGQRPVVGRADIQAFLKSFSNYKVLAYEMQLTSAVSRAHSVQQTGTYAPVGSLARRPHTSSTRHIYCHLAARARRALAHSEHAHRTCR